MRWRKARSAVRSSRAASNLAAVTTVSNSPATTARRNKTMKAARKNDGKNDPASQGLTRCALCGAKLAVGGTELNRGRSGQASIPVIVRLVRPLGRHANIGRLLVRHSRQLGADLGEMKTGDLL